MSRRKTARIAAALAAFAVVAIAATTSAAQTENAKTGQKSARTTAPTETVTLTVATTETETTATTVTETTTKATPEPTRAARYALTTSERAEIERTVMAEAGTEPFDGICAVALCILNAAERENVRPPEAIAAYGYTSIRKEPSDDVRRAVAAVFDDGYRPTDAPILYFYAPELCESEWHEAQTLGFECNGHRFFY